MILQIELAMQRNVQKVLNGYATPHGTKKYVDYAIPLDSNNARLQISMEGVSFQATNILDTDNS
jgi:hypothetical protein